MKKVVLASIFSILALLPVFGQEDSVLYPQMGHRGKIIGLHLIQNGQRMLSVSEDNTLRVWHIPSGKEIQSLLPPGAIFASDLHPEGTLVVSSVTGPESIVVQDIRTGQTVKSFSALDSVVNDVAWSHDGKRIAAAYNGSSVRVWDFATGDCILEFKGDGKSLSSVVWALDDARLFTGSSSGMLAEHDLSTGTTRLFPENMGSAVLVLRLSGDGKRLAAGMDHSSLVLWDLSGNKVLWTHKARTGEMSVPLSLAFSPDGKELAAGYNDGNFRLHDIETGSTLDRFPVFGRNYEISALAWSLDGMLFVGKGDGVIHCVDRKSLETRNVFQGRYADVSALAFSRDGRYLASSGSIDGVVRIWDLHAGAPVILLEGRGSMVKYLRFSPDGKILAAADWAGALTLWDWKAGSRLAEKQTSPIDMEFTADGKSLFVLKYGGALSQLSVDGLALLKDYGKPGKLGAIGLTADGKTLLGIAGSEGILRMDLKTGKSRWFFQNWGSFTVFEISPDGRQAAAGTDSGMLLVFDTKTGKYLHSVTAHGSGLYGSMNFTSYIRSLAWSPDGRSIATGAMDRTVQLIDVATGSRRDQLSGHKSWVEALEYSPDGQWLASGSMDTTIRLTRLSTGRTVILSAGTGKTGNQWLIHTDDGYWDGSRDCGSLVSMVQGNEVWNIDQFAVRNNRPDVVLERLGSPDAERISNMNALYQRRLRRLGIPEAALSWDRPVPVTRVTGIRQEEKYAILQLSFQDEASSLVRYQVYINDVPLYGPEGKPLKGKSAQVTERLELTAGSNKIEVSCLNGSGMESWRDSAVVRYNKETVPDLYFLAFGVSDYSDPAITDLGFAAKDALDLEQGFKSMEGRSFRKVHTRVYTDAQVTRQVVQSAGDFVRGSRPDDVFVLFIAGHGTYIRGNDPVYYYITSDARLADLPGTAVPFETVEGLLQGIPARKKLFLMDTCESGEADWGTPETIAGATAVRGLSARSIDSATLRGFKILGRSAPVVEERGRFISNDLLRRSGAIVFSSSRGNEYSLESAEWEQGAFTKEILRAFRTPAADLDRDGILSVRELQQFVSGEVPKLTGERQHPTVDRDNIFIDFGFPVR
jgi:WD40 repeat protein/uncharacterized caspase-like protein